MIKINNLLQIDEDLSSLLKFVYLRGSDSSLGTVGFTARNIHSRRIRATITGGQGIQFVPSTFELDPNQARTVLLNVSDIAFLRTLPVGTTNVPFSVGVTEILPPTTYLPEPVIPGIPLPPPIIMGCLDPSATNYNPNATLSDGSCQYRPVTPPAIKGCTNKTALNYNAFATIDDGSCQYPSTPTPPAPPVYGCTDINATNYNPNATINQGCIYPPVPTGCIDPAASNFNPNAQIDDGSCTYPGRWVLVQNAQAYSTSKTVITQIDRENSQSPSKDNNYVAGFYYTEFGYTETTRYGATYTYQLEGSAAGAGARPVDPPREVSVERGQVQIITNRFLRGPDPVFEVCNRIGEITRTVAYPAGTNKYGYSNVCRLIQNQAGSGGCVDSCVDEFTGKYGCTDPSATNYDPTATNDNNSCTYKTATIVYGCMDPAAANYNPSATVSAKCVYPEAVRGCTDPTAINYNPNATVNTGCVYRPVDVSGCTDSKANNYNSNATIDDGSCRYTQIIVGCIDPTALNYNPNASYDDGSCNYPTNTGGSTFTGGQGTSGAGPIGGADGALGGGTISNNDGTFTFTGAGDGTNI